MKKHLFILFFCIFVLMIGYGLTFPVLPFYIERLALSEGATSAGISFQVGAITGIFALIQFFFAPLWGKWSDRSGRRPLFLIGLGGYGMFMILFGLGTNLAMLYAARILGGIFSAALLPVATAYVTDLTSEEERARGMAWLGSALGLGIVVGPALGAFLSRLDIHLTYRFGHFRIDGFSIPFFVAALLSLLTLAVAIRWFPESLKTAKLGTSKQQASLEHAPPLKSVRWFIPGWLQPFLVFAFLNQFALTIFEGTFALHAKQISQFGPTDMGVVFVTCGFVMAGAQAAVVTRLIERLGEQSLLPIGFALMGVGLAMLMTTQKIGLIVFYVAVLAFGVALITPSLATLVSKQAGHRSGTALGQLIAASNLGQAGGPVVGGILFAWQIHVPYFLTALLLFATTVHVTISMVLRPKSKNGWAIDEFTS